MSSSTPILQARSYSPASIDRAAAILAGGGTRGEAGTGGVVILPTETVYGIAFSLGSAEARSRVKTLKNLSDRPNFVVHVPSADEAEKLLPGLSPTTRRILNRAWPGPVAFQLRISPGQRVHVQRVLGDAFEECAADNFITLRCPDNVMTTEILASVGKPVAMIAAALPGVGGATAPSPHEVSDIPEPILSGVDAVVDAGPTRYRKASTLARIDGDRITILRSGVLDERIVHRMADFVLLFVCSGNTCRSPMAGAIAQGQLAKKLGVPIAELPSRHVVVQSAGLHAMRGMRATREAVAAMRDRNLDLSTHISQPASLDLLRRADRIFTMTDAHRDEILDLLPGAADKVQRLDPEGDVDDPIGSGEAVYRQVADHLETVIEQRLNELAL